MNFFDLKPTKYAKCVDKIGVDSSYVGSVRIFRKAWKMSNMLEKSYFCNFSFKKYDKKLHLNKKPRMRVTKHLSTDADTSTDTKKILLLKPTLQIFLKESLKTQYV